MVIGHSTIWTARRSLTVRTQPQRSSCGAAAPRVLGACQRRRIAAFSGGVAQPVSASAAARCILVAPYLPRRSSTAARPHVRSPVPRRTVTAIEGGIASHTHRPVGILAARVLANAKHVIIIIAATIPIARSLIMRLMAMMTYMSGNLG